MDAPASRTEPTADRRRAAARARAGHGRRHAGPAGPPAAARHGRPRGTVVVLPGPRRVHREVRRDAGGARGAGASRSPSSTGAARAARIASSPIATAAMSSRSRTIWPTSTRSLARVEQLRLPRPFLMLSHSMGGHIGLRYLHAHPDRFAGSVMSAPMFGIRLHADARAGGAGALRRRDPAGRRPRASRRASATSRSSATCSRATG